MNGAMTNTKRSAWWNGGWRLAAISVLALAVSIPALAQQSRVFREGNAWIEETTGSLPAARNLSIKLDVGNLTVKSGADQAITYSVRKRAFAPSEAAARKQFEAYRITATRQGETALLRGSVEGNLRRMNADVIVQAPRSLDGVKASTEGGNEAVSGFNGRVDAETGGGNINLDDIAGTVSASSGGGNVTVGNVGSDLLLKTGGGNIVVGSAKGRILTSSGGGNITIGSGAQAMTVETGGGAIDVKHCGGELKAQTGGGSLDLGQVLGRADLQTGGGSIRLASANGPVVAQSGGGTVELFNMSQGARVETAGGPITAEFVGGRPFTGANLQTPAGDIVVYLGGDVKATIKASVDVASGQGIRSEFPEIHVNSEGGQWGPKSYFADGNLNGGGPVMRLHTTTGTIVIKRARK